MQKKIFELSVQDPTVVSPPILWSASASAVVLRASYDCFICLITFYGLMQQILPSLHLNGEYTEYRCAAVRSPSGTSLCPPHCSKNIAGREVATGSH